MSTFKALKLNILNVAVFAITGLIFFAGSSVIFKIDRSMTDLRANIEQHWREQARTTLTHTIEVFEKDYSLGLIDIHSNDSVEKWANKNFNSIKNGSATSDGWVGEIGEGIIISDQSPDCMIYIEEDQSPEDLPKARYFKDEYKNHKDPIQAKEVFTKISNGVKTAYGDNIWWRFDNDKEWIEFAYYPKLSGIDGEYRAVKGIENKSFKRYVFVLGTQSDEILAKYNDIFEKQNYIKYLIYFTMGISFLSSVIFMTVVIFKRCPTKGGN